MSRRVVINKDYLTRSLILLGFSLLLFWLVFSGKITLFINPRFVILTKMTATVLFIMFLSQAGRCFQSKNLRHNHHHNKSRIKVAYIPLVLPLLLGFLLPNAALDANLANKKGIDILDQKVKSGTTKENSTNTDNTQIQTSDNSNNTDNNQSFNNTLNGNGSTGYVVNDRKNALPKAGPIRLTDENFAQTVGELYANPQDYAGKEISMLGFVYTDNTFSNEQFAVSRYVITCCSADASVSGILCDVKNAANYKEGSWVTITGMLQPYQFNNETVPMIKVNSISLTQAPKDQYVYIRYQ